MSRDSATSHARHRPARPPRRHLSMLWLGLLLLAPLLATAAPHELTLAARVWGLAKYHHPAITACTIDWDKALLDRVDALEAAPDTTAGRSAALSSLLEAAGTAGETAITDATPVWIRTADIDEPLRQRLAWLAAQRPVRQCYVSLPRFLDFESDSGYAVDTPDRAHRVLGAFRYWNIIEYFFPYKRDIGRDWAEALDQWLPAILQAPGREAYLTAMRGFTAEIRDTHGYFVSLLGVGFGNAIPPPFQVRRIEGRPIVVQVFPNTPVSPGDEVLAVDGESMTQRVQRLDPTSHGSNPVARDALNLRLAIAGANRPGRYRFKRPDGSEYEVELERSIGNTFSSAGGIAGTWETRELDGCRMGIVDMAKLQGSQIDALVSDMAPVDAIVFDVRNYPNGTLWPLADRMYSQRRSLALFDRAVLSRPGTFEPVLEPIGGDAPTPSIIGKRMLVLYDERSISQAEFTVMGLQAAGNTLTFGSQTAAADGNIAFINLPGAIRTVFTGLGVYYPDGRPTQRIGIVPDVHVTPTIAGLAAGKDEVLQTALDCKWVQQSPQQRLPAPGFYLDPARSGEGLDVHQDGTLLGVLSYAYDDAGQPTWLLSGAPTSATDWGARFHSYRAGATGQHLEPAYKLDFHRGPYAPACAIADQSALHPRGLWNAPGSGEQGRCVVPLLLPTASDASGLWAGPPSDTGWGLSVHSRGKELFVHLYGYDAQGAPRWLTGTGLLGDDGVAEIALQRAAGFCRTCAAGAVSFVPAGSVRLMLDPAGQGKGSVDVEAFFDATTAWRRTGTALRRLVGGPAAATQAAE